MVWLYFLQVSSVLLWWWFFIEFIFKSFCYQHWCQWGTIEVKTLSEKTGLIWFISYNIILFIDNNIVRVWVRFLILVNWNQYDPFPFQFLLKEKATVATVATLFGGGGLETMMEIIIVSGGWSYRHSQKEFMVLFEPLIAADFSSIQLQYLVTDTISKYILHP